MRQLESFFSKAILKRGAGYFRDGRVTEIHSHGRRAWGATVVGTSDYEVALTIDGAALLASCECPYVESEWELCKHIWAAILATNSRKLLPSSLRRVDLVSEEQGIPVGPDPIHANPWFDRLPTRSQGEVRAAVAISQVPEEIVYSIRVGPGDGGIVQVLGRSRTKGGGWESWRPFRIMARQLAELDPFDRETIGLLQGAVAADWIETQIPLPEDMTRWWIERLAAAGRLVTPRDEGLESIEWSESEWSFASRIIRDEERQVYRIEGHLLDPDRRLHPLDSVWLIYPRVAILDGLAVPLELGDDDAVWLDTFLEQGPLEVPFSDRERLRTSLLDAPPIGGDVPDELRLEIVDLDPVPRLELIDDHYDPYNYVANVLFVYGDHIVSEADKAPGWIDGDTVIHRKEDRESSCLQQLGDRVRRGYRGRFLPRYFAPALVDELMATGWEVIVGDRHFSRPDSYDVEIRSEVDWFEVEARVSFGEQSVSLPEILRAMQKKQSFLPLSDGTIAFLPTQWANDLAELTKFGKTSGDSIRFRTNQALIIDGLLESRSRREDTDFSDLLQKIQSTEPRPVEESDRFRGELRPYQREGLGWLRFCSEVGLGGCLADDMGLGKTVQMLAHLESRNGAGDGPSLVVAPRSLLFNWRAEAERFTPGLRVLTHHGSDRATETSAFEGYDLILTTYGTLRRDADLMASVELDTVVLDEAQAIKNASSQVSKVARTLRANHRFALTGTPVENHLGELWSIFDFLNPGMLGTARTFQSSFGSKNVPQAKRDLLGRAVRPFVLRRTKEQVAPELPPRTEQTLYCDLIGKQRKQYDELREYYRAALLGKVEKSGMGKAKFQILEALLRLRQAACHPGLIDGKSRKSAKLDLLFEELSEVIDSGHRALVFSQFTTFLSYVRTRLDGQRIPYCYLDGRTRRRDEVVERFQSPGGPPVFLISLKAGGLGLNLTNADYVFLLDPWWNPAVEAQAIDRAHRIGQDRPVVAHRIIARDTVEEKILELQQSKRELAESIITADNSLLRKLDLDDLRLLLS